MRAIGKMTWDTELPLEKAIPFDNEISWNISDHSVEASRKPQQIFETERTREEVLDSINILEDQVNKCIEAPKQITRESTIFAANEISHNLIKYHPEISEKMIAVSSQHPIGIKENDSKQTKLPRLGKRMSPVVDKKLVESRRASSIIYLHPALIFQARKNMLQHELTISERQESLEPTIPQVKKGVLQTVIAIPADPEISHTAIFDEFDKNSGNAESIIKEAQISEPLLETASKEDPTKEIQPKKRVLIAPDGVLPNSNRTVEAKTWLKAHKKDVNILQEVKTVARISAALRKKPVVNVTIPRPLKSVEEFPTFDKKEAPAKEEVEYTKYQEPVEDLTPEEPEPPVRIPEIVVKASQTKWFPIEEVNLKLI